MWSPQGITKTPNWSWSISTSRTERFCHFASPCLHDLLQQSVALPYAWDLTSLLLTNAPGEHPQTASFLTAVSRGCSESDGACDNTMNMSSTYAVSILMLTSSESYKNFISLIWCSNSCFPKKTVASPQISTSYMQYQWLMQDPIISSLRTKIISRM